MRSASVTRTERTARMRMGTSSWVNHSTAMDSSETRAFSVKTSASLARESGAHRLGRRGQILLILGIGKPVHPLVDECSRTGV